MIGAALAFAFHAAVAQTQNGVGVVMSSPCGIAGCTFTGPVDINPVSAASSAITSAAVSASTFALPIANPTTIVVGQIASGTNIPAIPIVAVSTASSPATPTIAIAVPTGSSFLPVPSLSGVAPYMLVTDTTTPGALAVGTYTTGSSGSGTAATLTATGGSQTSNTISLASGGTACVPGDVIFDTTRATIPIDTFVVNSTATTIWIPLSTTSGGVQNGDTLYCAPAVGLSAATISGVVASDVMSMNPAVILQTATSGAVGSGATIGLSGLSSSLSANLSSTGNINAGIQGYSQAGIPVLGIGNGFNLVEPLPNSDTRLGYGACPNLPPSDWTTTCLGYMAGNAMMVGGATTHTQNTIVGGWAGVHLNGQGNFVTILGGHALYDCVACGHILAIGQDTLAYALAPRSVIAIGSYGTGLYTSDYSDILIGDGAGSGQQATPSTGHDNLYAGFATAYGLNTYTSARDNVLIGNSIASAYISSLNATVVIGQTYGSSAAGASLSSDSGDTLIGAGVGTLLSGSYGMNCYGAFSCSAATTASSSLILGSQVASTTFKTGQFVFLAGLSSAADTPAANTSNYTAFFGNSATPYYSVTGTNVPSTSTTVIAGNLNVGAVTTSNHIAGSGTAPTLSSCGISPSLDATASDLAGTVTEGTAATGCVITFNTPYSTAPHVVISSPNGSQLTSYSVTTTTLTIANISATGDVFTYMAVQ